MCDFEYFGISVNPKILKSGFNWNSTPKWVNNPKFLSEGLIVSNSLWFLSYRIVHFKHNDLVVISTKLLKDSGFKTLNYWLIYHVNSNYGIKGKNLSLKLSRGKNFFFFTFLILIKFTIAAYDKNLKVPH